MKGEKLFAKYYEPKLVEQGIDNVVLRTYTHIKGLATDDPDNSTELIFTPRKEVDRRLENMFFKTGEEKGIGITSVVSVKAKHKFLLLLDCALVVSDENEKELIHVLKSSTELMPGLVGAMVLRTLNSYHVAGFVPLGEDDWKKQMAQAILLKTEKGEPVADIRYIGHSLERGYGALRLSDYKGKPTPDFICYL